MTTLALPVNPQPVPPVNPAKAPEGVPGWKVTLQVISEIVIQALLPFAMTLMLYFIIPASIAAIVLPIAAVSSAFTISFLYAGRMNEISRRPTAPLPATAPRGIRNAGCNCWLNALTQPIRIDRGMTEWFKNLPHNLPNAADANAPLSLHNHLAEIPHFSPSMLSRISSRDGELSAPLNAILRLDLEEADFVQEPANLAQYLEQIHPNLKACIEELDPAVAAGLVGYVRGYLRNYYPDLVNLDGNAQELLQRIRDPQFVANLYRQDRQKIQQYFHVIEQVPNSSRHVHFLSKFAPESRQPKWNALLAFKELMTAYDLAHEQNLPVIPFSSQTIRLAIHALRPGISPLAGRQEDPFEGLTILSDELIPDDLKAVLETRKILHLDANPLLEPADDVIENGTGFRKREPAQLAVIQAAIPISHPERSPTLRNLVHRTMNDDTGRGEGVRRAGIDGVSRHYRFKSEQMQYVTAPPSLWIQLKRWKMVEGGSWECLSRLLPSWFPGVERGQQKSKVAVDVQNILEIQPMEGGLARYEIDGFIIHLGEEEKSGHYISCIRGKDAENNDVWYKLNDDVCTQLTDKEMKELRGTCFGIHYSKIED